MNKRFYFKQLQADKDKEGNPTVVVIEDSIGFDDIHRTRQYPDGTMIVLLKDGHEEARELKRIINKKGDEEVKRERVWVQTEVRLMPEDAVKLKEYTSFFGYNGEIQASSLRLAPLTEEKQQNKTSELPEPAMEQVGPDKFLN